MVCQFRPESYARRGASNYHCLHAVVTLVLIYTIKFAPSRAQACPTQALHDTSTFIQGELKSPSVRLQEPLYIRWLNHRHMFYLISTEAYATNKVMTVRTVYFECFPHYVGHLGHICGDRCLVFILCAGLLQAKCDKINLWYLKLQLYHIMSQWTVPILGSTCCLTISSLCVLFDPQLGNYHNNFSAAVYADSRTSIKISATNSGHQLSLWPGSLVGGGKSLPHLLAAAANKVGPLANMYMYVASIV